MYICILYIHAQSLIRIFICLMQLFAELCTSCARTWSFAYIVVCRFVFTNMFCLLHWTGMCIYIYKVYIHIDMCIHVYLVMQCLVDTRYIVCKRMYMRMYRYMHMYMFMYIDTHVKVNVYAVYTYIYIHI